jgi:PAS domain S-box-containing protein
MKASSETSNMLYFLSGGGEMGALTREYDWSETSLGIPGQWSHSLRSTLGIVLHSAFPMFLFWGKDLTCFYNDAFRPSLGANGKHPAIGKHGKEVWDDIWGFIGPLINQVITTGEAVWFEDQLVPFYRNGRIEDIYWTFSYGPAYGDDGKVNGVLVTCTETTDKVISLQKLTQSKDELQFAIEAAELATFDYNPQTNAFTANDTLNDWFGLEATENSLQKAMNVIVEKDRELVGQAIEESLQYASGGKYEVEYTIVNPHTGIERVLRAKGKSFFTADKIAYRLNGTLQDITKDALTKKKAEEEKERKDLAIAAGEFGLFEVDLATNTIVADDRFNAIYGFTEMVSREQYIATCHPEDLIKRNIALKEALASGFFDYEGRFTHQDGSERWLRSKGNIIYNDKKQPYKQYGIVQDITKEMLFSKKMKESEEQMRSMVESAPFPIGVYIGKEMRVEFANQSILDIWGKGNNVIGKSFKDVLPELDNQEVFKQLDEVFTSGIAFHIKNQRLDLIVDNKLRPYYFNYSLTPLFDGAGEVYGVMNTGVDLTDLHLAQQAIQKSEENLRNTILQAPVAMCIFKGPRHVVELANERMFELWGKPAESILHKPIFEGLPEAKDQGFEAMLDGVYTTGETFSAQGVPITLPRNGMIEQVYVNFVYEAYREADGTTSGVLAVAIDVTEQVLSRKKIEEAEEKTRLAMNSAELGLYEIIYASGEMNTDKRFKEIWDVDRNLKREQYVAAIHPDDQLHRKQAHAASIQSGQLDYQARIIRKDKSVHWVRITGKVIFDDKQIPVKLLGVIQDVTTSVVAQQRIEEVVAERTKALADANNGLQKSNAELAQFAYIASHDLQEPLRKISTFTQMLENKIGDTLDEQSRNYLSKINNSSARMTTLIRDVLTYSELEKQTDLFTEVDLNQVVKSTLTDYELLIEQEQATVVYEKLPVLKAIPLQMAQLFGNIIGNSLKFIRKDADIKPVIKISVLEVSAEEKKSLLLDPFLHYIKIQFADNGIGFKEEYADKIFSIFQRLHRKAEYEGTGIGLAMCKKIALNHHGYLNATGSSENGAVFNFIIPAW